MTQKIAVVTGATRGIGAAIATSLHEAGFRVIATYRDNDKAARVFAEKTDIETMKFNVADFDACQQACATIESRYGSIDVLVNNAGITRDRTLHKMGIEDWSAIIDANLTSCFCMCRGVINGMRDRGWGRIINISSINGQKGQFGQCNYAAAKSGLLGFTKSLAQENAGKGITVNAICPGYVETDMTSAMNEAVLASIVSQIPVGRMGKVDEIAALTTYLAGDQAAFITGASIAINGGQYMA